MDFKKRTTHKIENLVKLAVEQMPKEATHISLVEGYRRRGGAFGTVSCWTESDCVYLDDENNRVKTIKNIDNTNVGGWKYTDPANYVLYSMGLYRPYSKDNLRSIRGRYEEDLDWNHIYPINNLYSPEYIMKMACKEILDSLMEDEVVVTIILDYEYAKNRTDMKFHKEDYSFQVKIEYNGNEYTTPHMWNTKAHMLMGKICNELFNSGFNNIVVKYDMVEKDVYKFEKGHNWTDITFE